MLQHEAQAAHRLAGGDAEHEVAGAQRSSSSRTPGNSGSWKSGAGAVRVDGRLVVLGQPLTERGVRHGRQLLHRLGQGQAHDPPDRLGRRRRQALGAEGRLGAGDDAGLAVDERAVAVEHNQPHDGVIPVIVSSP